MGWTTRILIVSLLGLAACQQRSISGGGRRRQRISASKSSQASFNCPQDFGYYPHPTDCTQYYVCVFGGALQESCTGGLVYSHELETCDWPRNVDCNPSSGGSGVSTVKVTDPRTQSTSSSRAATEALTPSVGSFDPRFDHTFSSSQTHHTARPFEDGDRSGNQRALFRQSTSPKQQALTSSHFSQQAFFDTPVAEQNGRRSQQLIAKPVTVRPQVFRPTTVRSLTALRPTQPASPHSPPLVNDNNYTDLNFTDNDFLYYYDDLLYDYYDPNTQTAPTTQQPVHRPAATHSPIRMRVEPSSKTFVRGGDSSRGEASSFRSSSSSSPSSSLRAASTSSRTSAAFEHQEPAPSSPFSNSRDGITKAFEISDFDFDSTRPVSSFSFSGIPDPQPPTLSPTKVTPTYQPQPNRQHKQSHNARVESDSRSASHSPSSLSFSSSPSQSSVFSHSQPSDVPQSAPPPHFARIPAIGNAKTVHSQEQGSSFSQSASQALRALSNIPTAFPETLSDTPDDTPIQESFSSSSSSRIPSTRPTLKSLSSQSSSTNSGSSRSSKNPSRSNTRQPNSNRSPPRESSTPSLAAVDSSVPKRSSRITLKPVSVLAPSAPSRDIWRFPPRRPAPQGPTPPVDTKATKCDPKLCRLPDCYCGGRDIPGGFLPAETPQIVLLTFDDSVNDLNRPLYKDLFEKGRVNPNGCPIVSTMYVSHEWTDYSQVQNLYAEGHEIASHSIQHSFGEQFSTKKWAKEIAGQREILSAYGGVKMEDVRGMRAPFLAVGGNKMYRMLWQENFTYDSSMPVYENNPPSWPYTLDYRIFHDCMIPPCPTNSYPGLWQVPMVMWQDLNGGRCSMGDACTTPPDAEGVYKMLIKNFERHYTTNRAPFGLFYHAAWFTTPHHKEGFIAFLDTITAMDDVWLTTNWQLIQWLRDPTPLSRIKNFAPFSCNYSDRPKCTTKKVCNVWHKGGVRYMRTCQPCPETYPWTGNTGVNSPLNDP